MHRVTNHCDAQTEFFEWTSLQPFHGGDVENCFDVVGCRVRWSNVVGCEVTRTTKYCKYYRVLQGTTQYYSVLRDTTQYYYTVLQSSTPYYNVLLQYFSVLQSTIPVLLGTTKYYSLLQSTTPILLCTTKYYSRTTTYYSVLQTTILRTTKVLLRTTRILLQYYSVLQSTIPVLSYIARSNKTHLPTSNLTKILRLPREMTRIIDPRDNARSNRTHPPTSPNTAPATLNDSHDWCPSHMKSHLQCAEQQASPSNLTKYTAPATQNCTPKSQRNLPKTVEVSFTVRGRFDNDPTMIRTQTVISHPPVRWGYFARFGDAFCIENYNISRSGYLPRFHQILRLPRKAALQDHQILRLPRNMIHIIDPCDMKRYLQRAGQQDPPSVTKYCACHDKRLSWLMPVTYETSFTMRGATGITLQPHQSTVPASQNCTPKSQRNLPKTVEVSFTVRGRFDHDPTMIRTQTVISHPPVRRGYFARFGDGFCIENYNISRSGYLPRFHQILHLPRKATLQDHQILRLPRKVTLQHQLRLRLPCKVTLQLYWTVTLLSWYFTERILYWANWAVAWLNWTVTLLNCYFTGLWLYWAVALLSCYFTGLFALLNLRNSEVSQLNFLWQIHCPHRLKYRFKTKPVSSRWCLIGGRWRFLTNETSSWLSTFRMEKARSIDFKPWWETTF